MIRNETDVFDFYVGERSVCWFDIVCKGNTRHGSGLIEHTATEKVQFILNELLSYRIQQKICFDSNKQLQLGDITTINLTKITGGVQPNVVPSSFTLTFDCRIATDNYEQFKLFLNDVIQRTPKKMKMMLN
ncbi:unnamed protein product [Didymodactylos carnosus]|uniref:Peptidase M20 dimerisation domain-containing protein n=1 Tax=Didymodactylos carnosus TaxID=1234261 RepID=A0A8S2Q022_9BILA|nr:unnamed protein product [Didymodactylos carnosus]CAF4079902.1 unnamed protein product [Didymodactylos carnosus]